MNILTYVDPSPRGEWALKLTAEFAGKLAKRVVLLTNEQSMAANPALLDQAAEMVAGVNRDVQIEKKVRNARPRRAIIEEAMEHPYELTVFPPAGRNRIQRFIHGSRVRTVVRHIPSSVLVARRPAARIRRILAAVSASEFGQTTVGAGLEIARALGAELSAIHIVSSIPLPPVDGQDARRPEEELDARARAVLERVREEFSAAGVEPRILIREGMVVEEVVHEVDAGAYDLLVVGHHIPMGEGQTDLQQDLAERMIFWCPIPVLVVQPRRVPALVRS